MERLILVLVIFTSFAVINRPRLGYTAEMQSTPGASVVASEHTARATNQESPPRQRPLISQTHTTAAVAPGEGLGCFYHQGYYSHLPLFKDGIYTLPGSRDVSEPYQRPMTPPPTFSSSPHENPGAPQGDAAANARKQ